jgi:hypothetical protein
LMTPPSQTVPLLHSCPTIIINILGLDSAHEQKHVIIGFLSLAYLIQHGDL